jgi:molybdate transport system ATP-binding protein
MNNFKLSVTFQPNKQTSESIIFKVQQGERWYLSSDSGLFVHNLFEWLEGKKFLPQTHITLENTTSKLEGLLDVSQHIETIRFSTNYGITGQYYQQRYQATDNDNIIKLSDFLQTNDNAFLQNLLQLMGLNKLMHESLNMLSTGEYRKACIVHAALLKPLLLFIEDPYPGIDQPGKDLIDQLLEYLSNEGTTIVIVGSDIRPPLFASHCMLIQKDEIIFAGDKQNMPDPQMEENAVVDFAMPKTRNIQHANALQLINVSVKYNDRVILNGINWTIAKGDKWQLKGHNGAGKSLLLSLVYADNPQVYCNDVYLFDRKRGTGESIWDVKENIGFYSSELFRYFDKTMTVDDAIYSIVFQNPYKTRELTPDEIQFQEDILNYFDLSDKLNKRLNELSAANQRVVLLIGVLLKNTSLLVLDEPFQDFDQTLTNKFIKLIDSFMNDRTLIFVSHNPQDIPLGITKRYVLNNGNGKVEED